MKYFNRSPIAFSGVEEIGQHLKNLGFDHACAESHSQEYSDDVIDEQVVLDHNNQGSHMFWCDKEDSVMGMVTTFPGNHENGTRREWRKGNELVGVTHTYSNGSMSGEFYN